MNLFSVEISMNFLRAHTEAAEARNEEANCNVINILKCDNCDGQELLGKCQCDAIVCLPCQRVECDSCEAVYCRMCLPTSNDYYCDVRTVPLW